MKAAVSKLGSCARLHGGSCVGGSESRTTAGLCMIVQHLHHAKTFELLQATTNKFWNSFLPIA